MKQPYNWDYTIRVKTKEGTYEYEDNLENIDTILQQHEDYEEIQAKKILRCDKCKIELSDIFYQKAQFGTLKLCKKCNDKYLQQMEYAKKLRWFNGTGNEYNRPKTR